MQGEGEGGRGVQGGEGVVAVLGAQADGGIVGVAVEGGADVFVGLDGEAGREVAGGELDGARGEPGPVDELPGVTVAGELVFAQGLAQGGRDVAGHAGGVVGGDDG